MENDRDDLTDIDTVQDGLTPMIALLGEVSIYEAEASIIVEDWLEETGMTRATLGEEYIEVLIVRITEAMEDVAKDAVEDSDE